MNIWTNLASRVFFLLCFGRAIVACSGMKEDVEDSRKAQTDLRAELGIDSRVDCVTNFIGRQKLVVTVRLKAAPAGNVAALKGAVTSIVTRDFRTHVDGVQLLF